MLSSNRQDAENDIMISFHRISYDISREHKKMSSAFIDYIRRDYIYSRFRLLHIADQVNTLFSISDDA